MNKSMLSAERNNSNRSHTPGVWERSTPLGCVLVLVLAFNVNAFAAEPEKKEDPFRMKTIEGEIMGKTSRNISVEFSREGDHSFEALIPVDEKIKLKGYKSFKDIKEGDMIRAEFKEFYNVDSEGKEVRTGKMATSIQLVKNSSTGKLISRN